MFWVNKQGVMRENAKMGIRKHQKHTLRGVSEGVIGKRLAALQKKTRLS
jgi:hypothetical protein